MKPILLLILFTLTGCLQQGQDPLVPGSIPEDITISLLAINPPSKITSLNEQVQFQAIGGFPPYSLSLQTGYGSITPDGLFTSPSTPGTTTVKVIDSQNNSAFSLITISSTLVLSPANAVVGTNENFQFTAGGGVSPYTYSVSSGDGSINATTGLYAAGSNAGNAVIRVVDANGNSYQSNVTITTALMISPASVTVEDLSLTTFIAGGGVAPYTFSVYAGGGTINSSTGDYTAGSNAESVIIRVQDSNGLYQEANVSVTKGPEISNTLNMVHTLGTLQISANSGTAPLSYSIVSGTGSIHPTSGLFTAGINSGTSIIRVTDANGFFQDRSIDVFHPTRVSVGNFHICMVRINLDGVSSDAKCAGHNLYGQIGAYNFSLGDSSDEMGAALPEVALGTNLTAVKVYASYNDRVCVLFSNHQLKCFGSNGYGGSGTSNTVQYGLYPYSMGDRLPFVGLGSGVSVDSTIPLADRVASGAHHTCAIVNGGNLKCWGYNAQGQLGSGNIINYCSTAASCGNNLPTVGLGGESVLQVTTGVHHSCVLLSPSMRVKCWGYNLYGQLGVGDQTNRGGDSTTTPDLLNYVDLGTYLANPIKVKRLASGAYHNCALLENDTIKCWGWVANGALGNGSTTLSYGDAPGEMGDTLPVVSVSSTKTPKNIFSQVYSNCVVFTDDTMKCWGA